VSLQAAQDLIAPLETLTEMVKRRATLRVAIILLASSRRPIGPRPLPLALNPEIG